MSKPSTFARVTLAAAAGVMTLSTGLAAQAQPYGSPSYSAPYYDGCRRETNNRGILGALLGAGIGATVGSQIAARGHRTDGSVLGGALGALGGAAVGSNTAACTSGSQPYPQPYGSAAPPPPPVAYNYGYAPPPGVPEYGRDDYAARIERQRYDRDDDYAYGPRGERLRVAQDRGVGPDGCTLAESPIHMPDGRTQMRFVRVCMDDSGRYQVVD
jgi:hypothetical protein